MTDSSTVRGSGRASSTLVDVHGPGINKFWRKTSVDTNDKQVFDTTISAAFGDLFDGGQATSMISGGMENSFYLSDFPIASKPPFGGGELVGANLFFYPTEIDRSERGGFSFVPHYSFYMVDGVIGRGNEGNLTPYPTGEYSNSPMAVFSSNFSKDGYWLNEDFSHDENAKVVAGSVIIRTDPYIPLYWAMKNNTDLDPSMNFKGEDSFWDSGTTQEHIDFGTWSRYVDTLPTGEKVIFVEKKGWNSWGWDEQWVPVKGRQTLFDDPEWEAKKIKGTGYPKYAYTTEATYTLNPPISTDNTFFERVNRLKSDPLYDEAGALQHGSEIVFNSEDTLTGGSCMMMNAAYDETKSGSLGWKAMEGSGYPYCAKDSAASGENSGRTIKHFWSNTSDGEFGQTDTSIAWLPHRQRAVAVKKIPVPIVHSPKTGLDYTGEHGKIHLKDNLEDVPLEDKYPDTGETGDLNVTTSEIDFTMKVEELSLAPFYRSHEVSWNNPSQDGFEFMSMDTRSICVMLGTRPPRASECFFDYFYNTSCTSDGWNGKGSKATAEGSGAEGDRDGLSTGFVVVRPPYTEYTYVEEDSPLDGTKLTAKGESLIAGKGYRNGAERWKNSGIGIEFPKDGVMLLPLVDRKACNKVNGNSAKVTSNDAEKNRWSIFGGVKGSSSTGKDEFGGGGKGDKDSDYNDSWYLTNVRARFNQTDIEKYAIPLPEKEWLRVRIFLNGDSTDRIYFQIENADDGTILGRSSMTYIDGKSIWGSGEEPRYLSIWCNNHPATVATDDEGSTHRRWWGESRGARASTRTKLFVDELKFKNFNMHHNNATIDNANNNKSPLKIRRNPVTNAYMQDTVSPTYVSFGFENATDLMDDPTYLLFNTIGGDSTTPDAIGNNYIRATVSMQGWTVGGDDYERLGGGYFDGKISASGTGDFKSEFRPISPFKHWADSNTHGETANFQMAGRGLSINGSETGGAGALWDGTARAAGIVAGTQHISSTGNATDIENFSYKGLMKFNYDSAQILEITEGSGSTAHYIHNYNIVARENDYVAARVTKVDISAGEITVDDPSVLQLKEGTVYRLYFRGAIRKATSANKNIQPTYQDVYLASDSINDNIVKIKNELSSPFINGNVEGKQVIDNLWISPKLHWLIMEVLPYNSDNEKVEDRTYRSVVEVNRGNTAFPTSVDYGVTFNETTYNDGIYQNSWNLDFTIPDSQIINETDFGFGALDAEGGGGGELAKVKLVDKNLWHSVDLSGAITDGDKKEGDILTTMMVPSALSSIIKTTIATTENTTKATEDVEWYMHGSSHYEGVFRPFLLTTFEDALPTIEDFSISPTEGREFFPKFTWRCKDDDVWYGFIVVDDKKIVNQYQNAVLHMPLNTPKKSNVASTVKVGKQDTDVPDWYDYVNNVNSTTWFAKKSDTTPWTFPLYYALEDIELAFDPEGLSGWCHRFTQPNGGESVNALNFWSDSADEQIGLKGTLPKKEMSLIVHVTPDYVILPSANNQMIFDNGGGVDYGDAIGTGFFADELKFFKVYIDVDGYVNVEICPDKCYETRAGVTTSSNRHKITLSSKTIVPMDGITPTNIIVTLDAGLKKNNVKLFIDGKLEDTTGRSYNDNTLSSSNRWPFDVQMASESETGMLTVGNVRSMRTPTSQGEPFKGRIEEVVYYTKCIYPVNVDLGEYILEKPLKELAGNNKSKSYSARLFVKDYHNIRGTTIDKVASTASVAWRKSVPLFTEASD